ncbi:MAG: hypothetical protein SGI71_01965, partial [Verrucomicrobiota bacterium]|nr:hypothetical protein [Verrucomicrobiota bacterium]
VPRQPAAPTNKKTTPWVVTFNCRQWANLIVASHGRALSRFLEIGTSLGLQSRYLQRVRPKPYPGIS